ELGKLRIETSAYKTEDRENHEDREREKRVAPGASESLRQFVREECEDAFPAARLSAIDAAVRANDETVQVIDEARVARFGARNREIRGRASIDAAQFAHFFAPQTLQCRGVE